jgi:hypothetical protein
VLHTMINQMPLTMKLSWVQPLDSDNFAKAS